MNHPIVISCAINTDDEPSIGAKIIPVDDENVVGKSLHIYFLWLGITFGFWQRKKAGAK